MSFILLMIVIFSCCSIFNNFRNHQRGVTQIILTSVLALVSLGLFNNQRSAENHYRNKDVSAIKSRFKKENSKTAILLKTEQKLSQEEKTTKKEQDNAKLAYQKKKPEFEEEARKKKEQAQKELEEKQLAEKQKKEQEEQEKAQAEAEAKRQQEAEQQRQAEVQRQQEAQKQQANVQQQQQQQQQNAVAANNQGSQVLIAPAHGKRFHYDPNCRGLRNAKGTVSMTEQEAISQGYTRCGFE